MYVIDGLDAVDACFQYAAMLGIHKLRGWSLHDLWRLASGLIRQRRIEMVDQTVLIWGMSSIDVDAYIQFGTMEATGAGGPVQLDPEMQAQVDERIREIKNENSDLPSVRTSD